MVSLSTHVLDTSRGEPANGLQVSLEKGVGDSWTAVAVGVTGEDGRIGDLGLGLESGSYRLRFRTGEYGNSFYPFVDVVVELDGDRDHYHIPLLLSPFGYSTYRGS